MHNDPIHLSGSLRLSLAAVALCLALPQRTVSAQGAPHLAEDRDPGAQSVDVAQCERWLYTLAGEEFGGRGTGQDGYGKAAAFVAKHFAALGLEPRGENGSYYQHMPWSRTTVKNAALTFVKDGKTVHTVPSERLIGRVGEDTDVTGEVLLLNLEVPEMRGRGLPKIEGLDQVDAKGKVVFALVRASGRAERFARFAVMRALSGKQAAALVFLDRKPVQGGLSGSSGARRRGRSNPAAAARNRRPLDMTIGGDDAAWLFAQSQGGADPDSLPVATPLAIEAHIEIDVESEDAPAMNVFAVLPGSDPKLKDEYVVIGSHLDHLGTRNGRMFPGADDDGSGTTGVMAVAQMFAKNPVKPRRSILFVCFAGEEMGLLGSRYFVENCPIPLSSIAAELQMDMIGRSEEESRDGGRLVNRGETAEDNKNVLHLVGTEKLSRTLHELCMQRNEAAGFDIEFDQESLFTRSDHANFAYRGVPIAFFFTGIHKDYHQTTDTPDKIDYPKLLRVARYVYDIAFDLAQQDQRPLVDADLWAAFKQTDRRGRMPEVPVAPVKESKD